MKILKKSINVVVWIVSFLLLLAAIFIVSIRVNEWRPTDVEQQSLGGIEPEIITKDTLKVVSWNIGYAGLGDDMDFFMDGGRAVRCSEDRTKQNLNTIINFLKKNRDADFILLQEVDFDSKRSYGQNQYDSIRNAMPEFMGWYALNYVSQFVPVPIFEPIGKVKSGVVILSRYAPIAVTRLQFPGGPSFPQRMFDLKRCILAAEFVIDSSGTRFRLANTHNSAFDPSGKMRNTEMAYIKGYFEDGSATMVAGDWNCSPPEYSLSEKEANNKFFSVMQIQVGDFPEDMQFMADYRVKSMRFLDEKYNPGSSIRSVIDFAVVNRKIEPVSTQTVDLGFVNSDHNPVIFNIIIAEH